MIFLNPRGAPELACDACGCCWFDRMSGCCYECGAAVGEDAVRAFQEALRKFREARTADGQEPGEGETTSPTRHHPS